MFEQAFKNIDDILRREGGGVLKYTEQSSWLLFLKYLDSLEQDKATEAKLEGKKYSYLLDKPYRWEAWAAPKGKDGKLDHNTALTGDDLRDFVNQKLFPYLSGFKARATGPNTLEYKIGEIFSEIKNEIGSGYNLREIVESIDSLSFRSQTEKHELSYLYEDTVLDCPGGTFQGAGVKTVVLFFEKGTKTRKIWFYQLDPGRNMGKTNPLNDDDLAEFLKLQKTFADSPKSWSIDTHALSEAEGFNFSVKNPNGGEEIAHRSPEAIMDEIAILDAESAEVLANIKGLL